MHPSPPHRLASRLPCLLLLLAPACALAQTPDAGAAQAGLSFTPQFQVDQELTDNALLTNSDAISDRRTRYTATVNASDSGAQHTLALQAQVARESYARLKQESSSNFALSANGEWLASGQFKMPFALSATRSHSRRGVLDDPSMLGLTEVRNRSAMLGVDWKHTSPWQASLVLQQVALDSEDVQHQQGMPPTRDDQDRKQWDGSLRVGYQLAPPVLVYLKAVRTLINYVDPYDENLRQRNSHSNTVVLGLQGALLPTLTGQVEAGRASHRYLDPAFGHFGAPMATMGLSWQASERLGATLSLGRLFVETNLPGSPGANVRSAQLGMACQALPALATTLSYGRNRYDAQGQPTLHAVQTMAQLGASYTVNRHASFKLNYARTVIDASVSAFSYRDKTTAFSLVLSY